MDKKSVETNTGTGDPWKSKAVQKLYNIVERIFDIKTPDDRLIASAKAKAEAKVIEAKSQAEANSVKLLAKAETTVKAKMLEARGELAVRALSRMEGEAIRQQQNIEVIIAEAYEALPAPSEPISDEPVSEDFIHRFFDDCKNISDEQMRTVWGRLLAGEITQPGSYHPKTLGILRDLTKDDANQFVEICRFKVDFIEADRPHSGVFPIPVILKFEHDIYEANRISFAKLKHIETLGLLSLLSDRIGHIEPSKIHYCGQELIVKNKNKPVVVGQVVYSRAGRELSRLVEPLAIPGFVDYLIRSKINLRLP